MGVGSINQVLDIPIKSITYVFFRRRFRNIAADIDINKRQDICNQYSFIVIPILQKKLMVVYLLIYLLICVCYSKRYNHNS